MFNTGEEPKDESSHYLLPNRDAESRDDEAPTPVSRKRSQRVCSWTTFHILLCATYTVIFLLLVLSTQPFRKAGGNQLPLPAKSALKPELRYFPTSLEDNDFAGKPRPELDAAWNGLLQNDNIEVPKASIEALGLHSVNTRNGDGAIASLSVFHALHCLKKVYRMMYKEDYHDGKSGEAMRRESKHADHCVEYLRESLMCKPDLSLITYRWINDTAQHPDAPDSFFPTNFDAGLHECMNWEAIDEWAGQRNFDLYQVDLLDRPTATAGEP